jgi:hypothetical protein
MSSFVTLISSDNTEFTLPLSAAKRSGFVSKILKVSNDNNNNNVRLPLPDIHSSVLDIICQFLAKADLKASSSNNNERLDVSSALMHFDPNNQHDRQFVMELMMACDYLVV